MKISCPKCNQDYDIDENTADGQGFTCTKCNSPFFFKKEMKKREQPKEEEKKKTGLFECVDCGGAVSKMAYFCPHCGCPINAPKESKVLVRSFDISLWESIKIIIGFFIATIISVFIISGIIAVIGFWIRFGFK